MQSTPPQLSLIAHFQNLPDPRAMRRAVAAFVKRLQPNGERDGSYHIFFVGDPEGADITASAPPSVLREEIG